MIFIIVKYELKILKIIYRFGKAALLSGWIHDM